jgi:hypothetical protein
MRGGVIKPLLDERSDGGVGRDVVPLVHLDEHPGTYSLCLAFGSADVPTELPFSACDRIAPGVDDHLPGVTPLAKKPSAIARESTGLPKDCQNSQTSWVQWTFSAVTCTFVWALRVLIPRPPPCKGGALPTELNARAESK